MDRSAHNSQGFTLGSHFLLPVSDENQRSCNWGSNRNTFHLLSCERCRRAHTRRTKPNSSYLEQYMEGCLNPGPRRATQCPNWSNCPYPGVSDQSLLQQRKRLTICMNLLSPSVSRVLLFIHLFP